MNNNIKWDRYVFESGYVQEFAIVDDKYLYRNYYINQEHDGMEDCLEIVELDEDEWICRQDLAYQEYENQFVDIEDPMEEQMKDEQAMWENSRYESKYWYEF